MAVGTSLAVQLLGLHASTAGGMVPSLGGLRSFLWGLSSHMLCSMAKKKKKVVNCGLYPGVLLISLLGKELNAFTSY